MNEVSATARPELERKVLLAIPGMLGVVLVAVPFLPRDVTGSLLTQTVIALFVVLALIDLVTFKVPNLLVYPAIAFVLAATALIDISLMDDSVLGGLAALAGMFALALIGRGSMGMGDVKFACLVGCALGLRQSFIALGLGFGFGALAAIVLLLARLLGRKDSVPLTPFLALGAVAMALLSGTLVD